MFRFTSVVSSKTHGMIHKTIKEIHTSHHKQYITIKFPNHITRNQQQQKPTSYITKIAPNYPKYPSHITNTTTRQFQTMTMNKKYSISSHSSSSPSSFPSHSLIKSFKPQSSPLFMRTRSRFSTQQPQSTNPITDAQSRADATVQNMADLNRLAQELSIDPKTGKVIKLRKKRSWVIRILQICLFTGAFTATAVASFAYRHLLLAQMYNLVFKYRLWSNDFHHVLEYANDEHLYEPLSVEYIEGADIDDNIYRLQRVWYQRTHMMKKLLSQIDQQIQIISKSFTRYSDALAREGNNMMPHLNDPEYQEDVQTFYLLTNDIQTILDNTYLTRNELGQFEIILAQANSSFAIDTRKWKHADAIQEKTQFFENLDVSVNEAALYIDRLQELLATAIQQTNRFNRLGKFLDNREGFLEYHEKVLAEDEQHRIEYEQAVAQIETQLNKMQQHRDEVRMIQSDPELQKQHLQRLQQEKIEQLEQTERTLQQPYSFQANQSKAPPAMNLDLEKIEQEKNNNNNSKDNNNNNSNNGENK